MKRFFFSKIFLDFQWTQLLQPQFYIQNGGLWLILFVVFAETGLMAGFFLPGDSLLFVAGIFAHQDDKGGPGLAYQFLKLFGAQGLSGEWFDLILLWLLISVAGILGNMAGFWFGKKSGPFLFHRKDTFFFRKKYLYQAKEFYDINGGGTVVAARFLPIIRTFAPIIAGVVDMDKKKFMLYNVIGSVAWVFSMIFAGHFLQKWIWDLFQFDLKKHLEVIVLGIVLLTTAPVIIKLLTGKKKVPDAVTPADEKV
jgi:membrane-associated protein